MGIPLAIYPGTSEQAIYENIRELTNLYRFRCFTHNQQPMILSANLPNNTHIFIAEPLKNKSDEPSPKEQAEYLKNKVHEIIDAKQVINIFKSMLISLEPPPAKEENAENKEEQIGNNEESKDASDENTEDAPKDDAENKKDEEADIPPPPPSTAEDANTAVIESMDENEIVISKEVVIESKENEEAPKEDIDPYAYNGKYKALIDEIEAKMDEFQAIIMKVYDLSPDLLPPPKDESEDVMEAPQQTEEGRDNLILERLTAKLQPNMQQQIQQMQMQQMAMMAMLLAQGGNGGGANMMTTPMPAVGALPAFGTGNSLLPGIGGQGQQVPSLDQSKTSIVDDIKEDSDAFIFLLRSPKDDVLPERF